MTTGRQATTMLYHKQQYIKFLYNEGVMYHRDGALTCKGKGCNGAHKHALTSIRLLEEEGNASDHCPYGNEDEGNDAQGSRGCQPVWQRKSSINYQRHGLGIT